jgi:hypothetical protein
MAELHEAIILSYRKGLRRKGFVECKSPMPTYRPDIFAQRRTAKGKVKEEVVVEAEIESTLFNDHTMEQLVLMDQYLRHQKAKRKKIRGILLVPNSKVARVRASLLLSSAFSKGSSIIVYYANAK